MQMSRKSGYSKKVRLYMVFVQLCLLYFPIIRLFSISTDNGVIPASLCYFFSLIFLPHLLMTFKKTKLPPWYITVFVVYLVGLAVLNVGEYGVGKGILYWSFGGYLLLVIINVGEDFEKEDWARILETAACVFAVIHIVFLAVNYSDVVFLLRGYLFTYLVLSLVQFRGGEVLMFFSLGIYLLQRGNLTVLESVFVRKTRREKIS